LFLVAWGAAIPVASKTFVLGGSGGPLLRPLGEIAIWERLVFPSLTFLLRKLQSEVLENLELNGCVPSFFASMMIEEGLIVCGYALPESRPPCRRR
jgi:hypothetical protein